MSLIIFDFDGVIVDSFQAALETVREHQPELQVGEEEYRSCFEGNIYQSHIQRRFTAVFDGFFDRYLPKILSLSPISGVDGILKDLSVDHTLAIISSTDSNVLREWLKKYDLIHAFKDILGADIAKGKVEKFEMLFEAYGVASKDAVFITDTLGDLREAEKVGIPTIAVTYGYHDRARLEQGTYAVIIDRPDELASAIERVIN